MNLVSLFSSYFIHILFVIQNRVCLSSAASTSRIQYDQHSQASMTSWPESFQQSQIIQKNKFIQLLFFLQSACKTQLYVSSVLTRLTQHAARWAER